VKESPINCENQTPDADVDHGRGDNVVEVEPRTTEFNLG
jgi:hypothetical protein